MEPILHDPNQPPTDAILVLSNELLDQIFGYLLTEPKRLLPSDHRASLSVESFQSTIEPAAPITEDSCTIRILRLTCKRFANLMIPRQFARVSLRFTRSSFERLTWVVQQPHLAGEIKKLSYIIPVNHPRDLDRYREVLERTRSRILTLERTLHQRRSNSSGNNRVDRSQPSVKALQQELKTLHRDEIYVSRTMVRAEEQDLMIGRSFDHRRLVAALKAFTTLQQIRLMGVEDQIDREWVKFLRGRNDPAISELTPLEWAVAFEHAAKTLGLAYMEAKSPATRFSSRFMDCKVPYPLPESVLQTLAKSLTCLELQYHDSDEKILKLSPMFGALFRSAVNMSGLHLSFMSRPLSLPLEVIFHNVTWEKLRYIGFGAWNLSSAEIIGLLRRHRQTLRSVRLRWVLLKEGSRWSDVVQMIRQELNLNWCSLRGIGYSASATDSAQFVQARLPSDDGSDTDSEAEPAAQSASIDDRTIARHSAEAVVQRQGERCECREFGSHTLRDDGVRVSKARWKHWEKFVIKRCCLHDR